MDQLVDLLTQALNSVAPNMAGIIVPSIGIVYAVVKFLKGFVWKNLQGNVVQTLVASVSLTVVICECLLLGTFKDGVDPKEIAGMVLATILVLFGALGFDQITKNVNEPGIHPKPSPNAPPPGDETPLKGQDENAPRN